MRTVMTICLALTITPACLSQPGGKPVEIEKQWTATFNNDNVAGLKKSGFVATGKDWKAAWKKLDPKAEIPEVDFKKSFVLLSFKDANDPNRTTVNIRRNDKGVISNFSASTLIGFQPSDQTKVTFIKLPRKGITGVNQYDPEARKLVVVPLPKADPDKSKD